jgi:hypothetical protein
MRKSKKLARETKSFAQLFKRKTANFWQNPTVRALAEIRPKLAGQELLCRSKVSSELYQKVDFAKCSHIQSKNTITILNYTAIMKNVFRF